MTTAAKNDAIDTIRAEWARARPEVDTAPVATLGRVLRIARHIELQSDQLLAGFGVSRGEFDVLSAVRRASGALTPSDLARSLVVSNASITKRLTRLERVGLVSRSRSSADGRVSHVGLTAEGAAVVDDALPAQLALEGRVVGELVPADERELERMLSTLLRACESGYSTT